MPKKESAMFDVPVTIWDNCYDDSWKTEITNESFAHPAKMARGLIRRIFDYLIDSGRLTKGQIVCDPFGGIGTTGIEGASRGMQCFACELEPRFVEFAKANIELHRRTWEHFGDPIPVIVQGDSRKMCEVLESYLCQDSEISQPKELFGAQDAPNGTKMDSQESLASKKASLGSGGDKTSVNCGYAPIAGVVISSPPYNLPMSQDHNGRRGGTRGTDPSEKGAFVKYGNTPGQLEGLPMGTVDAVVSSPPYEANTDRCVPHGGHKNDGDGGFRGYYSDNPANLGNPQGASGETFWSAAKEIVAQCHQILRPGGVCVWVTKDFVRDKQRVPFSADWVKLCQSQGFQLVEWIQASLVKSSQPQPDLFGGDPHIKTTERKSFFRRLAEKKGSPRIDWEDVLVLQKKE